MAQSIARNLSKLARFSIEIERYDALLDDLATKLERLTGSGIIAVTGEAWLLESVRRSMHEARSLLDGLTDKMTSAESVQLLGRLEAILSDQVWQTLPRVQEDVDEKDRLLQDSIHDFEQQLAELQSHIEELRDDIRRARSLRAPVVEEEHGMRHREELLRQTERALSERSYLRVADSLAKLQSEDVVPDLRHSVETKIAEAVASSRQADLLLLQSPEDAQRRMHYNVLLRTPSEFGGHGINIQSSSTIVKQDREYMSQMIDRVTEAVNSGLIRAFSLRKAGTSRVQPPEPGTVGEGPADAGVREILEDDARDLPAGDISRRPAAGDIGRLVTEVGNLMYRLLMPEEMQKYLNDTPCALTLTTNDLELPWELMRYQDTFLSLERPMARMPMGRAFPRIQAPQMREGGKLRFLLIYADPEKTLPYAKDEIEKIREALESDATLAGQLEIVTLADRDITGRRLNQELQSGTFDVIHFAGHAAFDDEDPDLSGLLLHDKEVFFAQKIRRLLEGRPLVFLNACQTGRTANENAAQQVRGYLQKSAEGLASAFIYGGALGCIGSLWPVYDTPAAEFAIDFYRRLLKGYTIGEAMRLARVGSREAYPQQITWAAFVLYGDPMYQLILS